MLKGVCHDYELTVKRCTLCEFVSNPSVSYSSTVVGAESLAGQLSESVAKPDFCWLQLN